MVFSEFKALLWRLLTYLQKSKNRAKLPDFSDFPDFWAKNGQKATF